MVARLIEPGATRLRDLAPGQRTEAEAAPAAEPRVSERFLRLGVVLARHRDAAVRLARAVVLRGEGLGIFGRERTIDRTLELAVLVDVDHVVGRGAGPPVFVDVVILAGGLFDFTVGRVLFRLVFDVFDVFNVIDLFVEIVFLVVDKVEFLFVQIFVFVLGHGMGVLRESAGPRQAGRRIVAPTSIEGRTGRRQPCGRRVASARFLKARFPQPASRIPQTLDGLCF